MKCYTDPESMLVNGGQAFSEKTIPVHQSFLPVPMPAGTVQRASVNVPWTNDVFYYGLAALDKVGNIGPVSNLVPVFLPEVTTTTAAPLSDSNSTGAELVFKVIENPDEDKVESSTIIYLVSAGITAFLLILVTIFVVAICKAKRRQKALAAAAAKKINSISGPIQSTTATLTRSKDNFNPPPKKTGGL